MGNYWSGNMWSSWGKSCAGGCGWDDGWYKKMKYTKCDGCGCGCDGCSCHTRCCNRCGCKCSWDD